MLSYESSLFLAVVGSLIFAGCAWLFSFGNSVDMFDELRRMDKRQVGVSQVHGGGPGGGECLTGPGAG